MMVVKPPPLIKTDGSWIIVHSQILYENKIIESSLPARRAGPIKNADITKRVDQNNKGVPDRRDSSNCAFKSVLCK